MKRGKNYLGKRYKRKSGERDQGWAGRKRMLGFQSNVLIYRPILSENGSWKKKNGKKTESAK